MIILNLVPFVAIAVGLGVIATMNHTPRIVQYRIMAVTMAANAAAALVRLLLGRAVAPNLLGFVLSLATVAVIVARYPRMDAR